MERTEDPHHALNNPVGEPDPTEWPDPYDKREDPLHPLSGEEVATGDVPHPTSGATSTSGPHPQDDVQADPVEAPERDRLDD